VVVEEGERLARFHRFEPKGRPCEQWLAMDEQLQKELEAQ